MLSLEGFRLLLSLAYREIECMKTKTTPAPNYASSRWTRTDRQRSTRDNGTAPNKYVFFFDRHRTCSCVSMSSKKSYHMFSDLLVFLLLLAKHGKIGDTYVLSRVHKKKISARPKEGPGSHPPLTSLGRTRPPPAPAPTPQLPRPL